MRQEYLFKKISLRPDEEIVNILHHHPIAFLKQILITVFIILLAFFLMFPLFKNLGQAGVAIFVVLILTGLIYGGREFFIWYNNVFVITSQRIIDIDQRGIFDKTVSAAPYEKIMDLSYSVKGFWQTVFHLGMIKIKGQGVELLLKNIKDVSRINQLIADSVRSQTGKNIEIKTELTSEIKGKLTEDFLQQDELEKYDDYNLQELLEEYKETFGELSLKKLLVEELEKEDKKELAEDEQEQ